MSLRRLWVLVSGLREDSRSKRAMFGDEIAEWTTEGKQRGVLIYQASVANWQRGGGKKADKPKPPKPPSGRPRIRLPDDI
ncbi:hypothetical protein GCM10010182_67670 [Actinomadura cremea]|nr:hypothetical protein GCM10010182_67670 [Actinomadura cremea]